MLREAWGTIVKKVNDHFDAFDAEERRRERMWLFLSVEPRSGLITSNISSYLATAEGQAQLDELAAIGVPTLAEPGVR